MRYAMIAAAAISFATFAAATADAAPMPRPAAPDDMMILVRDGCGPGYGRGPLGQCFPLRGGPGWRQPQPGWGPPPHQPGWGPPPPPPPGWGPPPPRRGWGPPPGPGWGPPPQTCYWVQGPYGPRRVCR